MKGDNSLGGKELLSISKLIGVNKTIQREKKQNMLCDVPNVKWDSLPKIMKH